MFLEWKSSDWLGKVEAWRGNSTPDIQSGLDTYARKQAAVYHGLAIQFAKLWRPTIVSYGLQHSWITEYMTKHGVSLTNTNVPRARGIFKFKLSSESRSNVTAAASAPSNSLIPGGTTNNHLLLKEANYSEDSEDSSSGSEESDFDLEDYWDDELDF